MTRRESRSRRAARWLASLGGALVALQLAACGGAEPGAQPGAQPSARLAAESSALRKDVCFSVQDLGQSYSVTWDASLGLNASGMVVGTRGFSSEQRTGFVFQRGKFSEVGSPEFSLRAVNARGLAVGGVYSATQPARAISYYKGVVTDLGTLEGATDSWSWAVNDRGVAVGDAHVSGVAHAVAFYRGKVFDLGTLGWGAYPNGINDAGDVVGGWQVDENTYRGFIVPRDGSIQDFEEATGMPGVGGLAKINNGGTVCGSASMSTGYHGFLWKRGRTTDLGDIGFGWSVCNDVSDNGMAVGYAGDAWGTTAAFLWRSAEEGMIDLNTRIPADSNVYLWWGSGINSAGQITAWGWSFGESMHRGYLLSPVHCP
jgi:probable HAF family extracellular repeat protein